MGDSRFLDGGRALLEMARRELPDFEDGELVSLLSVALGLRIGEEMFPRDPRLGLVQAGLVMGVTAQHAQRILTQETVSSCVGCA